MKVFLARYIDSNIKDIMLITIMIFIGITLSVIYVNNLDKIGRDDVIDNIEQIITYVKEKEEYTNEEKYIVFKETAEKNIIFLLLIAFLGTSIIGFPIICLLIIYKFFSVGYTMSSVIASIGARRGIIFICFSCGIHNIIYIVSVYIMSLSSLNLIKIITQFNNENGTIKYKIIKHSIFLLISIVIALIASITEAYISNYFFVQCRGYL